MWRRRRQKSQKYPYAASKLAVAGPKANPALNDARKAAKAVTR